MSRVHLICLAKKEQFAGQEQDHGSPQLLPGHEDSIGTAQELLHTPQEFPRELKNSVTKESFWILNEESLTKKW